MWRSALPGRRQRSRDLPANPTAGCGTDSSENCVAVQLHLSLVLLPCTRVTSSAETALRASNHDRILRSYNFVSGQVTRDTPHCTPRRWDGMRRCTHRHTTRRTQRDVSTHSAVAAASEVTALIQQTLGWSAVRERVTLFEHTTHWAELQSEYVRPSRNSKHCH
jgi:hypothetical protein